MKIKAVIYRLTSNNTDIQNLLDYNFFDYQDSSDPLFWRNMTSTLRSDYLTKYTKTITDVKNLLSDPDNNKFDLQEIDISEEIEGYNTSIVLGRIANTTTISFHRNVNYSNIKENDLIVITEDGEIAFIGYVVDLTTKFEYGQFFVTDATIGNVGYLYEKTKMTVNRAAADLVVAGLDQKEFTFTAYQDIFNNKNVFEILEFMFTNLFFAVKATVDQINTYDFDFNSSAINSLDTFNVIFTFLKVLQKYEESQGTVFTWAEIEHGEHNVYNVMARSSYENFDASYTTPAAILEEVVKEAMYDIFIDFNGTMMVRPPLYNYLPYEMLVLNTNTQPDGTLLYTLNSSSTNYIKESDILSEDLAFNNAEVKSRTDARWMYKYTGEEKFFPSFYIDVNALVKYGFTNDQPFINPNALMNQQAATMLAATLNIVQNAITRTITVVVNYAAIGKYGVGELYYLEKYGMVGYLISIDRTINVDSYPTATLVFSFLRDLYNVEVDDTNIYDIANIYNRYGVYSKITTSTIDTATFNADVANFTAAFKAQIEKGSRVTVPAFKVFPTILDFILLTDGGQNTGVATTPDTATQPAKEDVTTNVNAQIDSNQLFIYRSFATKMQNFFILTFTDQIINGVVNQLISGSSADKFSSYTALVAASDGALPNVDELYKQYLPLANSTVIHQNYPYLIYRGEENVNLWQMNTPLTSKNVGQICQKLLNRIVECDADFKTQFPNYNSVNPQSVFTFEFAFNSDNIFLGLAGAEQVSSIESATSQTFQNLLEAHKEGRAIDIAIPLENTTSVLYLNKALFTLSDGVIQNTMTYAATFINLLRSMFKKHFDVVEETVSAINVYASDPLVDPFVYQARIFHLEVKDTNYTDIYAELLKPGDAS